MTRRHGAVATAAGLAPFGHLGWGYHTRDEFRSCAAEYIADGLAHHQWVEFVGEGTHAELRAELAALGLADTSEVKVSTPREFYRIPDGTDIVDPETAVATRSAAVQTAIDQGYSGFRAIVDATAVSRRPEQRDAFARFEFLIDQQMAVLPVTALCAYDLSQLDADAASLVCLHPLVDQQAPIFRIYAEPGCDFALDGELDAAVDEVFTTALRRIWPLLSGDVVVDAENLHYIGHQQLLAIDGKARAEGRRVVLRTGPVPLSRLARMLELTNLSVDEAIPASR